MNKLTLDQFYVIETIVESMGLGIVVADTSGKLLTFNEGAVKILGIKRDSTSPRDWPKQYGMHLDDGITPCSPEQSPLVRAINGESAENVEMLIVSAGNLSSSKWCSINLKPLKSPNGVIDGAVLVIQDTTERKMLAAEAARSNADLQQFASVAAHDLQEPLRTVAGFGDMLAEHLGDQLDAKSLRYIAKAKEGVSRMQILINDLLAYSRIQNKPPTLVLTDCNRIVESALKSLDASLRDHSGEVKFDALPVIVADGPQMSQLFQNLIGNALKFTAPERPSLVQIRAKRMRTEWLFSIEDHGIGIAPEFLERIFLIFQRLHSADKYAGTGIGLAICKRIVDRHGGRIWIESVPGKGSTIFFTIRAPNLEYEQCES